MESGVGTLAALLRERGAQYPALAAYTEAIGRQIASGTWGGPPVTFTAAPHVWDADRDAAAAELALVAVNGVNLWTTIAVALDDVHVGHPQAFGPVDDAVDE